MTEKEFVIWLHGFLEISGVKTLDENQLQVSKITSAFSSPRLLQTVRRMMYQKSREKCV